MVTGSYPPDICGAGDYTARLVEALSARDVAVEVVTGCDWGAADLITLLRRINAGRFDVVHIQYPTVGYGRKLGPHLAALIQRSVVTLHEASQSHFFRRLSLYFFLLARHIIFTNSHDLDYVSRLAPWVRRRSSVIPIGSNVRVAASDRNLRDIVYFGLIRPKKGLEDVLALAALIKERRGDLKVRIIGAPMPEHAEYYKQLRASANSLPVIWEEGLTPMEIAVLLSRARIGYLPFPDGASERRGSLIALLANGVATITTRGAHTPSGMSGIVEFAPSPQDALCCIERLNADEGYRLRLERSASNYAQGFDWGGIADEHIKIYQKITQ